MARKYYSIVAKEPHLNFWGVQFGDYDKECVQGELELMKDDYGWEKGTKFKIITTSDKQSDINAAVAKLNS